MSKNPAMAVMLYNNQLKRFQFWNHFETHCSEISHSCFEWASLWLQKTKLLQSRQYDGDKWSDGGFVSKKIIEWIHLSLVNLDDVAQSENQAKQSLGSARRAQKTCKRLGGSSRGGGGVGGVEVVLVVAVLSLNNDNNWSTKDTNHASNQNNDRFNGSHGRILAWLLLVVYSS